MLVNSFADVVAKRPSAFLEIYGSGELEAELKAQIVDLGLEKNVFLMGNVSDIHFRIKDAAVFCLSSDYEGLSNALLEAMAMGIPCVSTNCAGADEYITNGENGFIVNVGDANGMTNGIISLLENDALRKNFAERSVDVSKAFLLSGVIKEWDKIILQEGDGNE